MEHSGDVCIVGTVVDLRRHKYTLFNTAAAAAKSLQ